MVHTGGVFVIDKRHLYFQYRYICYIYMLHIYAVYLQKYQIRLTDKAWFAIFFQWFTCCQGMISFLPLLDLLVLCHPCAVELRQNPSLGYRRQSQTFGIAHCDAKQTPCSALKGTNCTLNTSDFRPRNAEKQFISLFSRFAASSNSAAATSQQFRIPCYFRAGKDGQGVEWQRVVWSLFGKKIFFRRFRRSILVLKKDIFWFWTRKNNEHFFRKLLLIRGDGNSWDLWILNDFDSQVNNYANVDLICKIAKAQKVRLLDFLCSNP